MKRPLAATLAPLLLLLTFNVVEGRLFKTDVDSRLKRSPQTPPGEVHLDTGNATVAPVPAEKDVVTTTTTTAAPSSSTTEFSPVGRSRACKMVVGIDSVLFDYHEQNMTTVINLVQDNVARVNAIFAQQVFDQQDGLSDVYFHVSRIQVMYGTCDSFEDHNCTMYREEYLRHFDRFDFADFCLGYMFTHIDFSNGTAGLAHIGSVCRPDQNTGFITTLNYGDEKDLDSTVATLAHEIGHNFGAKHDNDLEGEADTKDCKGQGFLMNDVLETGPEHLANRMKFSPCSLRDMKTATLSKIGGDIPDCFVSLPYDAKAVLETAICGNGILEPGEQCDCGMTIQTCNDACCYPGVISAGERRSNDSALPCSRNQRHDCLHPPGLVFGIYVPFAVIFASIIIIGVVLVRDWRRGKACFAHVTGGNVRIVR